MAEFVEFKLYKGDNVLVNIEHIIKVRPEKEGTYIYLDTVIGNQSSMCPTTLHVEESYSVVKRKLHQ